MRNDELEVSDTATQSNIPPSVVVQVNFQPAGEPYHFLAPTDCGLETGDWVVVETSGGTQGGHLIAWDVQPPESIRAN